MTAKDITSRDLLKRLATDFAYYLLGLEAKAIELLETQNQRVEDRRADLVARMRGADGAEFLLHIEVANNNTTNMPLRMLRYYTDIRLAGHSGQIRQFLIYIGSDSLTMPAGLDEPDLLDYRYGLIDMHRVDCTGLLEQDTPAALVLAILCDFGDRNPQEVVTYIVRRLWELMGTDERGFREHMTMLQILSKNRDLEAQIEEAEHMLTEIDIESMPFFSIGFERGEEDGLVRGREEGREEGEARVVRRLLNRHGVTEVSELLDLPVEEVERIAAVGDDDVVHNRH